MSQRSLELGRLELFRILDFGVWIFPRVRLLAAEGTVHGFLLDLRGRESIERGDCSIPVLDAHLRIDAKGMRLCCPLGDAKDPSDFRVGLALLQPVKNFALPAGQTPGRVRLEPFAEGGFIFRRVRVCRRQGSVGPEAVGDGRDVREQKVEQSALALGEIGAVTVQADEQVGGIRGLRIGEDGDEFAVNSQRTIERVIEFGGMEGLTGNDVGKFPGAGRI